MAIDARWRFDPFGAGYAPIQIDNEEHIISFIPEIGRYGVYAHEAIFFENPSSVNIVANDTGLTPYTEVPRLTIPIGQQFRVDYLEDTYFSTGLIEFPASENGVPVLLSYKGLGTINHPKFRLNVNSTLPGNADVEGDLTVLGLTQSTSKDSGSLIVEGGTGIEKNLYVGGLLNVSGGSTLQSTLDVSGNFSTSGALTVSGFGSFDSDNIRFENGQLLYNAYFVSGVTYNYTTTNSAWRLDLATGLRYQAISGTADTAITWYKETAGELFLSGFAGHGSTNTFTPYFTTVVTDYDPLARFSYTNGSVNGLEITADKDILVFAEVEFAIAINELSNGCISINSTATPLSVPIGQRYSYHRILNGGSTGRLVSSAIIFMSSGQILRPAHDSNLTGSPVYFRFNIIRDL